MNKISIKDIARQAGVCIGTVSRVINNLDRVHPDTREKILKLIEKTGYRPSSTGRSLVSGKTQNVLVVLHNIADPYCAAISKIFSQLWHRKGYKMLLGDSNYDPTLEREHLARARDGSIDGLLVSPVPGRQNISTFRDMAAAGFPFVSIDNRIDGAKTACIKYNDQAAAELAVAHLASKGHRHIAFMQSTTGFRTVQDRFKGYRASLEQLGLPFDEALATPRSCTPAETAAEIRTLMQRKPAPTAMVTENEIMAMVCMNTLIQAGYRIPEDIAVIAIGDTLIPHFAPVPMTTVSLRHDLMCREAVETLTAMLNGSPDQSPAGKIITPELIIRISA